MVSDAEKLTKALQNAQAEGVAAAISILVDDQPHIAPANQNWDSAIAMLRIFLAQMPASGGESDRFLSATKMERAFREHTCTGDSCVCLEPEFGQ